MLKNQTADEKLNELGRGDRRERKGMEKKLTSFAQVASVQQSGPLDETSCHIKGLPDDLKVVRRRRIGRHRVFYTGYHTACSYEAIYIKLYKDAGKEDELDPAFHNTLRRALASRPTLPIYLEENKPEQ